MFRFSHIAVIAASFVTVTTAVPANAKSSDVMLYANSAQVMQVTTKVCLIAPASQDCADYQDRLIRAVAEQPVGKTRRATLEEVGRRQLDALIASLD